MSGRHKVGFKFWLQLGMMFIPVGINSAIFGALSPEMAASVGYTLDEISVMNIVHLAAQLLTLLFAPFIVRKLGCQSALVLAVCLGITANLGLTTGVTAVWYWLAWGLNGVAVSMLLVAANMVILARCRYRAMTGMLALSLTFTTLLPMSVYPWLLAEVAEHVDWQVVPAVQAWCYGLVLLGLWLCPQSVRLPPLPFAKSGKRQYLLVGSTTVLAVFVLMRGTYYNWLDHEGYQALVVVLAVMTVGAVMGMKRTQQRRGKTASVAFMRTLSSSVFLYNGFLAGFAVMSSGALMVNFMAKVLNYSHVTSGWAQVPAIVTMLAGMVISVLVANQKRIPSDAITPIGVVFILASVFQFSHLPSYVGVDELLLPLCLRGFGVGLLNVSVTIAVMAYFKPEERLEGISLFYYIRTFGGLIGSALFARLIQVNGAQSMSVLSQGVQPGESGVQHYLAAAQRALATHGTLANASLSAQQLGATLKQEVFTMAISNALLGFILAVFVLAPVLIIGKKVAAKRSLSAPS